MGTVIQCPQCGHVHEVDDNSPAAVVTCSNCLEEFQPAVSRNSSELTGIDDDPRLPGRDPEELYGALSDSEFADSEFADSEFADGRTSTEPQAGSPPADDGDAWLRIDDDLDDGVASKPRSKTTLDSNYAFTIECPTCSTRIDLTDRYIGKRVRCPDCHSKLTIKEPSVQRRRPRQPSKSKRDDSYGLPETPQVPMLPVDKPRERQRAFSPAEDAMRRAEAEVQAEERANIQGVRDRTKTRSVTGALDIGLIIRWILLSVALQFEMSLITGALARFDSKDATIQFICMILTTLSGVFGLFLYNTLAVAMLTVMRERALGRARVEDWPAFDFMDWLFDSFYVGFPAFMAVLVGMACAQIFRVVGDQGYAIGLVVLCAASLIAIYPIFQLSAMGNGSPVQIVSPTVLRGLAAVPTSYLGFTATALGLFVGAAVTWQLRRFENTIGNLIASLAAIGAVMLYYRLLGRLIWLAQEALHRIEVEELEAAEADSAS